MAAPTRPSQIKRDIPPRHAPRAVDAPEPATFNANLDALARTNAPLADRLRQLELPPDAVRFVLGRDGQTTAQLKSADGDWQWLAASSAPSVSAVELAARFEIESSNLAIVGAASGRELLAVLARLGFTQALFCVLAEQDGLDGLTAAAAALRTVDLSGPLADGRLVLASDGDGPGSLAAVLADDLDYAPPGQVLRWPWQTPDRFAAITARLGQVSQARLARVGQAIGELTARLSARPARPIAQAPRVAAVASARAPADRSAVEGIAAAAGGRAIVIEGPRGASPVALAAQIAQAEPDLVVLVGRDRFDFAPALPASIPVALWALDARTKLAEPARLARIGPNDFIFAADAQTADALVGAGVAAERIDRLPPAIDPAAFPPTRPEAELACDVLLIGDAADLSPEAMGIEWASHQRLWEQCCRQIRLDAAGYHRGRAERVLDEAIAASGVAVRDASVRKTFLDAIGELAGPAVIRAACVESLRSAGLTVRVVGGNWDTLDGVGAAVSARPTRQGDWARLLASAKVAAFVPDDRDGAYGVLVAAASGTPVLVRQPPGGPAQPVDELFDQSQAPRFAGPGELSAVAARLAGDESARRQLAESARARVQRDHTFAGRWATLLGCVRRRAGQGA